MGQAQTGTGQNRRLPHPLLRTLARRPNNSNPLPSSWSPPANLRSKSAMKPKTQPPNKDLHVLPIYGGRPMDTQVRGLRSGARPRRRHSRPIPRSLGRGTLMLAQISYLVLDEADRMFDLGFRDDIRRILRNCPHNGKRCCSPPPCRPTSSPSPSAHAQADRPSANVAEESDDRQDSPIVFHRR